MKGHAYHIMGGVKYVLVGPPPHFDWAQRKWGQGACIKVGFIEDRLEKKHGQIKYVNLVFSSPKSKNYHLRNEGCGFTKEQCTGLFRLIFHFIVPWNEKLAWASLYMYNVYSLENLSKIILNWDHKFEGDRSYITL